MHEMMTEQIDPTTDPVYLEQRDNRLAILFQPYERVWILEQTYNSQMTQWLIDLVRMGKRGQWMHQRYIYEVPSQVIYFRGEVPLSEAEFANVRRSATNFRKHEQRQPSAN